MQILHVIPSVSVVHGGPTRAMFAIEAALSDAGATITTLTTDDDGPNRRLDKAKMYERVNGVQRVYLRKSLDFYKVAPGAVPWLWQNVRRYDVVHIHALFSFMSICTGIIARLRGVPYIVRPLGTLAKFGMRKRRPWLKRLSMEICDGPILRKAAAIHFTSVAEKEDAARYGVDIGGYVIPLGLDRLNINGEMFERLRSSQRDDALNLLFLGRLDPIKNIEGLLRAIAILTREKINTRLDVAGKGTNAYLCDLKELTASLGLTGQVVWHGQVDEADKVRIFSSADIFILPSYSENFGIAAVEAMAAGLPCVLSHGVAISCDANAAGAVLGVTTNPESIADGVRQLVNDNKYRRNMGFRAKQYVRENYTPQTMAQRLINLYETVAR